MEKKQQYVLGGILFIFAFSFGLNEFINSAHKEQATTDVRGIASVNDNAISQNEIQWERNLARTLSESHPIAKTHIADKPTDLDQLIFGSLQGRYEVEIKDGVVVGIRLKNGEVSGVEMNVEELLQQHAAVFSRMNDLSKGSTSQEGDSVTETYTWKDAQGSRHSMKVGYVSTGSQKNRWIKSVSFQ